MRLQTVLSCTRATVNPQEIDLFGLHHIACEAAIYSPMAPRLIIIITTPLMWFKLMPVLNLAIVEEGVTARRR